MMSVAIAVIDTSIAGKSMNATVSSTGAATLNAKNAIAMLQLACVMCRDSYVVFYLLFTCLLIVEVSEIIPSLEPNV